MIQIVNVGKSLVTGLSLAVCLTACGGGGGLPEEPPIGSVVTLAVNYDLNGDIVDYRRYTIDTSGRVIRNTKFTSGPDATWFTEDDVVVSYGVVNYDSEGNESRNIFYSASGTDGIWFTADDIPSTYTDYSYNSERKLTRRVDYIDSGADGLWFTADDGTQGHLERMYDLNGNLSRFVSYNGRGPDGILFTADDIV